MTNDAAGSFNWEFCPDCGAIVKIFYRGFSGNGKKCPECRFHIQPSPERRVLRVITYQNRKRCGICKKKLTVLEDNISYCYHQKDHKK